MEKGDLAPDFALVDQNGELRTLSEFLASGPLVLFFYPAAMTTGCTAESCHFRDLAAEFTAVGAERVGISPDPVPKQQRFSSTHGFDFPLLSDPDGRVATRFGVRRMFPLLPIRRHTFVINTDRRVLDVIGSEFNFNSHADKALQTLRARS